MRKKKIDGKHIALKSKLINSTRLYKDLSLLKLDVTKNNFKSKILDLCKHPKIYKGIFGIPYPKSMDKINTYPNLSYIGYVENQFLWDAYCLVVHEDKLISFIKFKKEYSILCINGEFHQAELILDDIELNFGLSLWLIRNRILIAKQTKGIKGEKDYSSKLLQSEKLNTVTAFLVEYASLRNTNEISLDRFRKYFDSFLDKAKKVNLNKEFSDYLIFEILQEVNNDDFIGISFYNSGGNLPIIDRYNTFSRLFSNYVQKKDANQKVISSVNKIMEQFYKKECEKSPEHKYNNDEINYCQNLFTDEISDKEDILKKFIKDKVDWDYFFLVANIIENEDLNHIKNNCSKFKFELLNNMFSCIKRTDKAQISSDDLLKTASIFITLNWSDKIIEFVKKISSSSFYHVSNYRKSFSFYNLNEKNELTFNEYSNFIRGFSGVKLVNSINKSIALKNDNFISKELISESSSSLITSLIAFKNVNYKVALDNIKKAKFIRTTFLDVFKFKLKIACLIKTKEWNQLLNFTVEVFLLNKNYRQLIPYKYILDSLPLSNEVFLKNISYPIFLFLSYQENGSIELLKEGYEDFMCCYGVNKPSDLIEIIDEFNQSKAFFFIEFVCIPEVIEIDVLNFQSSEDVAMERILTCRKLSDIIKNKRNIFTDEINNLTQKLMISASLHSIEKSKIYVDIDGVKKLAKSKYEDAYSKYLYLLETEKSDNKSIENDLLTLFEDEDEGVTFQTPTTMIDHQFLLNFINIRNIFTSNSIYGLDVALSCDIRHGILSGAIRGKIVEQNLITNKDGEYYQENEYWLEKLDYLEFHELTLINSYFESFSKKIDNYIEFLNDEIMQIKIDTSNPKGMFNFQVVLDDQFDHYKKSINTGKSFEEFLDITIERLWNITDKSLIEIREFLRGNCKDKFYEIINDLINNIEKMNKYNDLKELTSSIIELRTMISTELNQISNWFTRSKISNTPDYKINFLVDLAEVMVNNNFPDIDIKLQKKINSSDLKLQGRTLKNLSTILFILLSNVIKHGRLNYYDIFINIEILSSNEITFKIENKIRTRENYIELSNALNEKIIDLSKSLDSSIIKKEGGSGFYKIAKILRNDLNTKYKLSATYPDKNTFSTSLSFNIEKIKI